MTLPNGEEAKVDGIGEVKMRFHNSHVGKLTEVRYVSSLKKNLISLGKLDSLGYTVQVKNGGLEVIKGSRVILKSLEEQGLCSKVKVMKRCLLEGRFRQAIDGTKILIIESTLKACWA